MDPLHPPQEPFRLEKERQRRIYERLKIIGRGPAAFFRDACRLLAMEPPLETASHLIAHCIREMESAIRAAVETRQQREARKKPQTPSEGEGHAKSIANSLEVLGVPSDHPSSEFWRTLAGRGHANALHGCAHRSDLGPPRPVDQEFEAWWSSNEGLWAHVTAKCETVFFTFYDEIDRLLSGLGPGKDAVKALRNNVPQNDRTLDYFFKKAGPEWLKPLKEEEYFRDPPAPEVDPEDGGIRLHPWPESQFLVRVAKHGQFNELVATTALEVPSTENTLVLEDLTDVACALPPVLAARFVRKAVDWLKTPVKWFLPEKLGRLVVHLATGGEAHAALELARGVFEVLDASGDPFHTPRGHVDPYEYDHILSECREVLIGAAASEALVLFSEILERAIRMHLPSSKPPEDFSTHWRAEIGDDSSRGSEDIMDSLTTTVRDAAKAMVDADPEKLADVVAGLEQRRWRIFQRVALWLTEQFPGDAGDAIRKRLHEQYGQIEPSPEERPQIGVLYGTRSPKTAEELGAMSTEDLVASLRTWRPKDDWDEPSVEGLCDAFKTAVATNPKRFSGEASALKPIPRHYVYSLLTGLESAAKDGKPLFWSAAIEFCAWVAEQRDAGPRQRGTVLPDWRSARYAVLRLLQQGFKEGPSGIDAGSQLVVWSLLEKLSSDPDPSPEEEQKRLEEGGEPVQLSISSVRGELVHTLPYYASWRARHLGSEGQSATQPVAAMPELKSLLERLADARSEPSLAVRSAMGQKFGLAVSLDKEWAKEIARRLFSREPPELLGDVAWEGFVVNCRPNPVLLEVLRDQYRDAVERLGFPPRPGPIFGNPEEHLIQHVMFFYCQGLIGLDETGGLFPRFCERAPHSLREHLVEYVGRSLRNTKGDVPPEIAGRLKQFWESRVRAARGATNRKDFSEELAAFGWWFSSGKLDVDWSFQKAMEVLELSGALYPQRLVAERLDAVALEHPERSVQCLEGLVEAPGRGGVIGWSDHARRILETAIASKNQNSVAIARRVANKLGSMGFTEFRNLGG